VARWQPRSVGHRADTHTQWESPPEPGHPGDRGAVSVEHALLLMFIAVAIVVAIAAFGTAVDGLFQQGKDAIPAP
jgi:Flp pilus assembly pilin Flp